jgi:hypothetical protein
LEKLEAALGDVLFKALFSALSSDPIRGEAADNRSQRGHAGVVRPQIMIARREDHHQYIEGERQEKQ